MIEKDYFKELLGVEILEVGDGFSNAQMNVTKNHTNFHGFTHGGAIFALADCAFAEAVNFGEQKAVAVQVSINFLRPSFVGDVLIAKAKRVSEGKTFGLYEIAITKEEKTVAVFTGLAYKT